MSETIGRRYARALLLALSDGEGDADLLRVDRELTGLAALMSTGPDGSPDFRQVVLNPSFPPAERERVLADIAEAFSFHAVTRSFIGLLTEKGRLPFLPVIATAFQRAVDGRLKRVRATITSARVLETKSLAEVVKALESRTGMTVVPETVVDPSVISGVSARIGGTVYDRTLRAQLNRLSSSLLAS
jgi:F-type H+-transporting ATPase subunit delta